jgi:hypothetical protein
MCWIFKRDKYVEFLKQNVYSLFNKKKDSFELICWIFKAKCWIYNLMNIFFQLFVDTHFFLLNYKLKKYIISNYKLLSNVNKIFNDIFSFIPLTIYYSFFFQFFNLLFSYH